MRANRAFFDCLIGSSSWAEMSWWALIATLSKSIDRVLLRSVLDANVTCLAGHASIHVQVSAWSTVLWRHAASKGTRATLGADLLCTAREGH